VLPGASVAGTRTQTNLTRKRGFRRASSLARRVCVPCLQDRRAYPSTHRWLDCPGAI